MLRTSFQPVVVLLLFGLITVAPFHAQQAPGETGTGGGRGAAQAAQVGSIEERTSGMQKIDGYFPLYWDERTGSLFLEIPRFYADFLLSTGLAACGCRIPISSIIP